MEADVSSDSGGEINEQEIEATFEGRNIEGEDFHGIKQLLQQLFPTEHIDLSQMTDMLISQHGIGSVLKQGFSESDDESEDDEMVTDSVVFGVTSVLNLSSHLETPCVQQLHKLIKEASKKSADQTVQIKIEDILTKSKLGFIINERYINIPSRISSALFGSLEGELQRMQKKNSSYNFEYYLIVCKAYRSKVNKDQVIYSNAEEEIFVTNSDCCFEYSIADKADSGLGGAWKEEDEEYVPFRSVVLFKADKLNSIFAEVKSSVQG